MGTDGSLKKASAFMLKWNKKAAAIALGSVKSTSTIGPKATTEKAIDDLLKLGAQLQTPVTTGDTLRAVGDEWSLRHIQFKFGGNYFNNARVFFFSGVANHAIAKVMAEYSANLAFADPVYDSGVAKLIHSPKDLALYDGYIRNALRWLPGKEMITGSQPVRELTDYVVRKSIQKSHILVVPHYDFHKYLDPFMVEDLKGKTIITSTAYDDRIDYLKDKGIDVIIDTTPKILKNVVGVSVLEALLLASLKIPQDKGHEDDLLEIISDLRMEPRIIYPSGKPRRINRFAYIVHPPTQEFLKKLKPIEVLSDILPDAMSAVEKAMAYCPPFVYSKVTGIKSDTGVEAEGWLIALGITPEQMQAHDPEFTTKRILAATKLAKQLGAQIVGLGMLPKSMKDTSEEVAKHADLPITTGNSYVASATLWAAAEAVRRLRLHKLKRGKIIKAKAMVIGATGAVGSACSHLLATAFEEVHLVGRNMAKLLALQESVQKQAPAAKLHVSIRADTNLGRMDLVAAASSGARHVLDIMQVKPGGVIMDINLPMIFSKEDVAKRPDVLVIRSGEIRLPGKDVEMADIGLPPQVAYAGLAEVIALTLEGRFEVFTAGSSPQWDKVREIYKLGLKHGMKLEAISGVNGVVSDEEITKVKALSLRAEDNNEQTG
jgi:predicted amino acid dehydrogenase